MRTIINSTSRLVVVPFGGIFASTKVIMADSYMYIKEIMHSVNTVGRKLLMVVEERTFN